MSGSRSIFGAIRGHASQAAAARHVERRASQPPQEAKVTRMPNGLKVVTVENYSPTSRLAVVYGAASRHETHDNLGVSQCIRIATNGSSKKATAFGIARNLMQFGMSLTCTTSREHTMYSVECMRSLVGNGMAYLNEVSTSPYYKPWEVCENEAKLKLDAEMVQRSPEIRLMEMLHKAAFRDTLGNSLYMREDMIGVNDPILMKAFVDSRFVSQNGALIATGIDHEDAVHLVRKMTFRDGNVPETKAAKYYGGELRAEFTTQFSHVAMVSQGVSLSSADLLPLQVLQQAIGAGPFVKYSSNVASSKINKAAAAAASNPFAATTISTNYTDTGLFGFQIAAHAQDMGKILKAVMNTMGQATKGTITDEDVQRAKRQVKVLLHMELSDEVYLLEHLGVQALMSGQVVATSQIDAALDKVTAEDVNRVAKKIIAGKPTMVALGDLSHTPHLDDVMSH